MLAAPETIEMIAGRIAKHNISTVVVDPVRI